MFDKDKVINSVNKSWPKDLIIRYLYVALAPAFQRDLTFFRAPVYRQLELCEHNRSNSNKVMCLDICKDYKNLYNSFEIDCEIITTNNYLMPHYGLIVYGDTAKYFIDPLKDLHLNQYRCETAHYGIIPLSESQDNLTLYPGLSVLPQEYLREMDNFLGLVKSGLYNSDIINILRNELLFKDNTDYLLKLIGEDKRFANDDSYIRAKIELMNTYLINLGNVPGAMERELIYKYLISELFKEYEQTVIRTRIGFRDEIMLIHDTLYGPNIYQESKNNESFYLKRR